MEAAELGIFMISACVFTTLIEYPGSPVRGLLPDPFLRRALIGLAMACTAVILVFSGWGKQSGAHFNPAVTLTFLRLKKIRPWDALISFFLFLTVLFVSNTKNLGRYTGLFSGALVATYITFESPLSGMSMNPARSFASAFPARAFDGLWIYFLAPPIGMLLAAELYVRLRSANAVYCAKYHHHNGKRCIFDCRFAELQSR